MPAIHGARDVLSVMSVTKEPVSIVVQIGDSTRMIFETNGKKLLSYFEVPFDNSTTGPVVLSVNGESTTGPEISQNRSADEEVSAAATL
jgi:glucan endo-1,3-alpha-glucosidase